MIDAIQSASVLVTEVFQIIGGTLAAYGLYSLAVVWKAK